MTILGIIWFCLIFVLIAGYFVLDGFDLGAGVLSPFVAKNDEEKAIVRSSVGPVWDGNEVWLLTAGGALFAAFAPAYATTFSGFYLAIMLVLMGLIVRAVSLEFAGHDKAWSKLWNALFFVGSLLPALLFGVAAGNVFAGIPMDANGDYIGVPLLGLVTPFTLLTGLLGLSFFLFQGASWLSLKAPLGSEVLARAKKIRGIMLIVGAVLFFATAAYALLVLKPEMAPELSLLRMVFFALVIVALAVAIIKNGSDSSDLVVFIATSAACVMLVGLWASMMFPNLVVAGAGDPVALFGTAASGENITIATAASSELALTWMLGITCVGLPLVLAYHFIIYRTFRGRVKMDELDY